MGVVFLSKRYETLRGRRVWVSVTERYVGAGCLGKRYGALRGGGVSG